MVTFDVALTYTNLDSPVPTKAAGPATGEVEALDLATGKVEWDTKVKSLPLGAATVSNDLVFTTLVNGSLIALNRHTSAIVYQRKLPTTSNAPIAIAGHTVLVPAGASRVSVEDQPKSAVGGVHDPITILSRAIRCLRLTSVT